MVAFIRIPIAAGSVTVDPEEAVCFFSLRVKETEDFAEVELIKESGAPFCALLLALVYPEQFCFRSAEQSAEMRGFNLYCEAKGDCLYFLLDSAENFEENGSVVKFIFDKNGAFEIGSAAFELRCVSDVSACCWRDGEILPISIFIADEPANGDENRACSVSVASVNEENGRVTVRINANEGYFACGIEVSVFDLSEKKEDFFSVIGVANLSRSEFLCSFDLSADKNFCLIIVGLGWSRDGAEEIESRSCVFIKGMLFD